MCGNKNYILVDEYFFLLHLDCKFSRYANINLAQLQEKFRRCLRGAGSGNCNPCCSYAGNRGPSEQNSVLMPLFNPADMVMVNFSDMPLSMANAFEKAVKANDGFLQPSLQAFNQYWDRVANGYGLNGAAAQFSLSDVDPITGRVQQMPTLEQLKSRVRNNGEA
ncbi:type I-E CRISPR-associated protein Cas7/Cse4/CasC [Escherichia coli]